LLQSSGTAAYLEDLWFVDQRKGWVVGDSGLILRTEDGGNSWIKQNSKPPSASSDIFCKQRIQPYAWIVGDAGIVLKSDDAGQSWQQQPAFNTNYLLTVFFTTPKKGWIGGGDGLFYTTDGGSPGLKKMRWPKAPLY